MTHANIAPGSHFVQFFENEQDAHRAIATYFSKDARLDDFCIMIARPRTFSGVLQLLASAGSLGPTTDRICFVDAEDAIAQFMNGQEFDREGAERFLAQLLTKVPSGSAHARVKLYGEVVDVLFERRQHAVALQIEDLACLLFVLEPRLSIFCGYSTRHFDGEGGAAALQIVRAKHTDVLTFDDPGREYAGNQAPPSVTGSADTGTRVAYVVDDDVSMRRSLARLLTLSNWRVRLFDSAEAFLKEADSLRYGCLVLDIQLGGMTGLDLMALLAERGYRFPVIAMSGFLDERTESEALRLGARAFLRKPFEPQILIDTLARAVARSSE